MTVVVILGVIASLALVNYNKSIQMAYERDTVLQLKTMFNAFRIYYDRAHQYPTGADLTLDQINTTLGLNVSSNGITYTYHPYATDSYQISATYSGLSSFTIVVIDYQNQAPFIDTTALAVPKDPTTLFAQASQIPATLFKSVDTIITSDAEASFFTVVGCMNNPYCSTSNCLLVPNCN